MSLPEHPIQVFVAYDGKTKQILIRNSCTVEDFMRIVENNCLPGVGIDRFFLVYAGEELELGRMVKDYRIQNMALIAICGRLAPVRSRLTPLDGHISLTGEPCCMTYDDGPGESRAKMACGCSISVDAMCTYFEIEIDKGLAEFKCPNCRKDWPYFCIRHVLSAKYRNQELQAFDLRMEEIYLIKKPGVQQCPFCHFHCEWQSNSNRVQCVVCTKQNGKPTEFCWQCLNPWKGGLLSCGNQECGSVESKLQLLQTCETKTIGAVPNVPSVRACDNCGTLINHKDACKHMKCKSCGYEFCFICLGKLDEKTGMWPCGSFLTPCQVAPRQTTVTRDTEGQVEHTRGGEHGQNACRLM